mgnify:CR=1 FL=1
METPHSPKATSPATMLPPRFDSAEMHDAIVAAGMLQGYRPLVRYPYGTDSRTGEKHPDAVRPGSEKIVRDGNKVKVYMTAIRSHFTPDNIEGVKMGDVVFFHVTNLEQDGVLPGVLEGDDAVGVGVRDAGGGEARENGVAGFSGREIDGEVAEPHRVLGGLASAKAVPGVHADVVVVAPRRHEEGARHLRDGVEAEDLVVEGRCLGDIADLQVHVPENRAGWLTGPGLA